MLNAAPKRGQLIRYLDGTLCVLGEILWLPERQMKIFFKFFASSEEPSKLAWHFKFTKESVSNRVDLKCDNILGLVGQIAPKDADERNNLAQSLNCFRISDSWRRKKRVVQLRTLTLKAKVSARYLTKQGERNYKGAKNEVMPQ